VDSGYLDDELAQERADLRESLARSLARQSEALARGNHTLTVSADGSAQFTAVSSAISAARPGDQIVVGPGRYSEDLRLEFPLSIIGKGQRQEVVLEPSGGGLIRGVSIRGNGANPVALLMGGTLSLIDCDVAGPAAVGLHIAGGEAWVNKCRVHGMGGRKEKAISVTDGDVTLAECEIIGNFLGVDVAGHGGAKLRACRILRNDFGVRVGDSGTVELTDCHASGNTCAVLVASAYAEIRDCVISGNRDYGVHLYGGSRGVIENNDLTGNGYAIYSESKRRDVKIAGNTEEASWRFDA
jgi:parallel beta-helix repeat protein